MKKIIAIAACAALAASALAACDSRDGRIDDNSRPSVVSGTTSQRMNESKKSTSRAQSRNADTHSGEGVLHDTASMIGEVGEDIADGADNIGSSVTSNFNDMTGNESSTDSLDNM